MDKAKIISYIFGLLLAGSAFAEDALSRADSAVANILFEYEGSEAFASYTVSDSGFVDIVFANNTPNVLYSEILYKLKNHPDIDGVLAGKTGPICSVF